MSKLSIATLTAALMPLVALLPAQSTNGAPSGPHFDAASIKHLPAGSPQPPVVKPTKEEMSRLYGRQHGRYNPRYVTMKTLISLAWAWPNDRLIAPDWMSSENYDVAATMPAETTDDQVRLMLRNLLIERVHLQAHIEERQTAVYALLVGKGGPKLQKGDPEKLGFLRLVGSYGFEASSFSMDNFAGVLSLWTDRPVINRTGISGVYDFSLDWRADATAPAPPASDHPIHAMDVIVKDSTPALRAIAKYGLRAERRKVPLKYLIVDHAEKEPTAN